MEDQTELTAFNPGVQAVSKSAGNSEPAEEQKRSRAKHRHPLAQWVLFALVAGIACGLLLGEQAGIKIVADTYVSVLQVILLPYIVLSLITGIGRLELWQARRFAGIFLLAALALWVMGTLVVTILVRDPV